jgi:hypothetical protein
MSIHSIRPHLTPVDDSVPNKIETEMFSSTDEVIPYDNIKEILGKDVRSFMAYGHSDCLCLTLARVGRSFKDTDNIPQGRPPLSEVYDWRVGNDTYTHERPDTSKTPIVKILSGQDSAKDALHLTRRQCKAAITNIILDNCLREGPITPILFSIQVSLMEKPSKPLWQTTPETVLSQTAQDFQGKAYTTYITASELRRAYKMCTDPILPKEIREVARRTLKFVAIVQERIRTQKDIILQTNEKVVVSTNKTITYRLKEIPAPWEGVNAAEFERQLNLRKSSSKTSTASKPYWRSQVAQIFEKAKAIKKSDVHSTSDTPKDAG